jgi:hypothetical protein
MGTVYHKMAGIAMGLEENQKNLPERSDSQETNQ